jgi:N utilization substance protein A
MKFYLLEVHRSMRGPQLILSRTHKNLLKRLFELEVPEIYRGVVEIKSIAREAGYRSKVAVSAKQDGVDPVGSCVGLRGIRIQNIVNELNGERIDVIQWDAEPSRFVANSLSPAQVLHVTVEEESNTASVIVPDRQLSLAIGKEGQNARLAAKLTGWRIDIKPESAMQETLAALPKGTAAASRPPAEWKETAEKPRAGQPAAVPVAAGSGGGPGGLRFAEDLATAGSPGAAKKAKKSKKERPEEGAKPAKGVKKSRRFEVVDEDEDFAELLEEYSEWSADPDDDADGDEEK